MTTQHIPTTLERIRRSVAVAQPHLLAIMVIVLLIVGLNDPTFVTGVNIGNLLNSMAFVGFVALGETVLLLLGEFDLSVGAVSGLSAVASAQLMANLAVPLPLGVVVCLAIGTTAGIINGILVTRYGVPSFIATFGMASFAGGLGLYLTRGEPVPMPQALQEFGAVRILPGTLGLSTMFLVFAAIAIITEVVLRHSAPGRMVHAVGGDIVAARSAGIPTRAVKTAGFAFAGMLAAVAGVLQAGEQSIALSTTGSSGVELQAIAAAIVGGVSILGGAGSILGAFVGLLLLALVKLGIVSLGIPINWQSMAVGTIIIGAIALDFAARNHQGMGGKTRDGLFRSLWRKAARA